MIPLLALLLSIQTPATGRITGHIVEARTGQPLAAVLIKVQDSTLQGLSDADGAFAIEGVAPGKRVLVVSAVGYGLLKRDVDVTANDVVDVTITVAEGASTYVENVTVGAPPFRTAEPGVASQQVLGSRDLLTLRGVIADDPFRAVQAMPTVATGDDFNAEFAVRGHGPRYIGVSIDGVDSPLLIHTVRAVRDTGSLALINSDILESATLLSGAYPQRLGQHLGARVDFTTRDPARDRLKARMMLSGTAATTVWEGPLASGDRAGWMIAVRRSYIDWLLHRIDPSIEGTFGFLDGQAKVVFNPTTRNTITAMMIGGRSKLQETDPNRGLNSLDQGLDNTIVGSLRWQFTPTDRLVFTNQAYVARSRYQNRVKDGRARQEGLDDDVTMRSTMQYALTTPGKEGSGHFVDIGAQAQLLRGTRIDRTFLARTTRINQDVDGNWSQQAGWINYRWATASGISIQPGVRLERLGDVECAGCPQILRSVTASPWLLTEWPLGKGSRFLFNVGRFSQTAGFDQIVGAAASGIRPERAQTADAGIVRDIGDRWRVRMNGYYRRDDRALRRESSEARVNANPPYQLIAAASPAWTNALTGDAHGAELTVERRVLNGVSGWISYAYGDARMHDARTGETYAADYDQRHMVNAYATYRSSSQLGLSARFRYGSNFPVSGYFQPRGEDYFIGPAKNEVRLPTYARLDLRADRTFTKSRSRITLFIEVINAMNRRNMGPGDYGFDGATLKTTRLMEKMFPILPSAGVLLEF